MSSNCTGCRVLCYGTMVRCATLPPSDRRLDEIQHFDDAGNVKQKIAVEVLAALAQDSRLGIFRLLLQHAPGGLSAGAIAEQLALPNATLSFHLKELSRAGLLRARQEGRFIFYGPEISRMNELIAFLTENCCGGQACGVTARGPTCDTAKPGRSAAPRARRRPGQS